jgi:hypothetical protein
MQETYDPAALHAALAAVPAGSWSLPSTYQGTGVHHGYRRVVLVSACQRQPAADPFGWLLDEFGPVRDAWLSSIDPGGFIVPHRDAAPWFERWQMPIQASGLFDDYRPEDGRPFRVTHWREHSVWNDGDRPRIHVVIDRDIRLDLPPEPFAVFPVPPEYDHMVKAAR